MPDRWHIVGLPHGVSEKLGEDAEESGITVCFWLRCGCWLLSRPLLLTWNSFWMSRYRAPFSRQAWQEMLEAESELSSPGTHVDGDAIAGGRTAGKGQRRHEMPRRLSPPTPRPLYRLPYESMEGTSGHFRPTFAGLITWARAWGHQRP